MPILDDIMDHEVFGPLIRQGIEQGREQARRAREEKSGQGAYAILRRVITKRFGPLPAPFEDRLSKLSIAELGDLAERLVDAINLADLLDTP